MRICGVFDMFFSTIGIIHVSSKWEHCNPHTSPVENFSFQNFKSGIQWDKKRQKYKSHLLKYCAKFQGESSKPKLKKTLFFENDYFKTPLALPPFEISRSNFIQFLSYSKYMSVHCESRVYNRQLHYLSMPVL